MFDVKSNTIKQVPTVIWEGGGGENVNLKERRNTVTTVRSLLFCEGFCTERARYNTDSYSIENNSICVSKH